jgi:mRNA interferase RelE/StbE
VIIEFDSSFIKSLEKISDTRVLNRIAVALEKSETAERIQAIPNVKKLIGFADYYRIKVGDYRLGFEKIDEQTIRFVLAAHRKDIYRKFP